MSSLQHHVVLFRARLIGGPTSFAFAAGAVAILMLAWLAGSLMGWVLALLVAVGLGGLSLVPRRVSVRMDLYTVRVRNVLMPGAGRRVPVRSIRSARLVKSTNGLGLELHLTTEARLRLWTDDAPEVLATLRRFHAATKGKRLREDEDLVEHREAHFPFRRNRSVPRPRVTAPARPAPRSPSSRR